MFSSYVKKLLSSFLFLFIYFLFITVVAFVWIIFKSSIGLTVPDALNYCIITVLTLLIELLAVYYIRIDNLKSKEAYEKTHGAETYAFQSDFRETLRSKAHILHTAAFSTLMLPLLLLIGMGTDADVGPLIIGTIALTMVSIVLFAVISAFLWCIVHKKWLCSKKK